MLFIRHSIFIIIIYKMQNNQNHSVSKCQAHYFSLKPLHKERRPNLSATVALCRSKQTKNKKKANKCSSYDGPIFNKDRSYATPAFILPSEKIEYVESAREFIRDHQKKVRQYEEQLDDLLIPKPRSKSLYCNVCRQSYTEYLEHIQSASHHSNIRSSQFNNYILDLQKNIRKTEPKELSIALSSETGTASVVDDDDVEIIGSRGRKRIKSNISSANNASSYPFAQNNPNYSFTGPTQSMFYPNSYFPNGLQMMGRFNDCRDFYSHCQNMAFNPYFPFMPQNAMTVGYPMYCTPFQPLIGIQIFQRNQ